MVLTLASIVLLGTGGVAQRGQYQIHSPSNKVAFRLDTETGEVCHFTVKNAKWQKTCSADAQREAQKSGHE